MAGWLRPGDLDTIDGISDEFNLALEHQPALMREVLTASTTHPLDVPPSSGRVRKSWIRPWPLARDRLDAGWPVSVGVVNEPIGRPIPC